MIITISGPPGSGKTTVSKLLAERLGYEVLGFGQLFREMAKERGLSLAEMGELAERDPSIDREIDARIVEIASVTDNIILESRLAAHMLARNGIDSLKVYLDADPQTRALRVSLRDGEEREQAADAMKQRQLSEAKRYHDYYGIDLSDLSVYDVVINTSNLSPKEIVDMIEEKVWERA
ncbi:MAG: ribonucleoprotein complex subunit 4 [Candidatus Methanomethylophilaceae archaeon]|nr:ribonucleoprotein complex subunit 4 [Candidatus Methanomethylophilaceae archaeon]MDI3541674.1 ribonucleoprotein complex subunit 4 [Candidatus Methanomethylophilaceae archaeon]HIJ00146.1 AAA family ATPase [Candidatus Methanomethylophilaceae archaeon]